MSRADPTAARQVLVVLRLDDVSAVSPMGLEQGILDALARYGLVATFGVIPFACDSPVREATPRPPSPFSQEKVAMLRAAVERKTIEVALHGFSHQTWRDDNPSEFAGRLPEVQEALIGKGKKALEDWGLGPARTFIPPWNTYDQGTVRALEAHGFHAISAGWKGVAPVGTPINFVPATTSLGHLQAAVKAARGSPDLRPLVVALFHHYDFAEAAPGRGRWTLARFGRLLDWLAEQPDVRVVTVAGACEALRDLGVERFRAVEAWRRIQTTTPRPFREAVPVLFYHDSTALARAWRTLGALYAALALCVMASVGFALGFWLAASEGGRWSSAAGLATSLILSACGVIGLGMSPGALRTAWRAYCRATRCSRNNPPDACAPCLARK